MNDDQLTEQFRKLRPAPLPRDLQERLAAEPEVLATSSRSPRLWWAAAATIALLAVALTVLLNPHETAPLTEEAEELPISIVSKESTLLGTRTLAQQEHEGQLWELIEEQWRDDTVAICSATTAKVRSSIVRPEVRWVPVVFQ